jgi:3'-phosphoadenosine 5'-phosphosulfate (PAPS) 3'-phosphatase
MDDQTIDIRQLISACIDATRKGGDIARKVVASGNLGVQEKTGPNDLLTIADGKVQDFIMTGLLKLWPSLFIIGEEAVSETSSEISESLNIHELDSVKFNVNTNYSINELTIYIDPIDATKEFTEGLYSNVTILIGIALNSDPIAGVVYQPWSENNNNSPAGILVWSIVGHGLEGITVSPREMDINNLVVATTRSHLTDIVVAGLEKLKPGNLIRLGGCGFKMLFVLCGKADVYYFPTKGTNKWDTCGPEALLRSVGGTLTDPEGNAINYNRDLSVKNDKGIIVTLRNHQQVLDRIKNN